MVSLLTLFAPKLLTLYIALRNPEAHASKAMMANILSAASAPNGPGHRPGSPIAPGSPAFSAGSTNSKSGVSETQARVSKVVVRKGQWLYYGPWMDAKMIWVPSAGVLTFQTRTVPSSTVFNIDNLILTVLRSGDKPDECLFQVEGHRQSVQVQPENVQDMQDWTQILATFVGTRSDGSRSANSSSRPRVLSGGAQVQVGSADGTKGAGKGEP